MARLLEPKTEQEYCCFAGSRNGTLTGILPTSWWTSPRQSTMPSSANFRTRPCCCASFIGSKHGSGELGGSWVQAWLSVAELVATCYPHAHSQVARSRRAQDFSSREAGGIGPHESSCRCRNPCCTESCTCDTDSSQGEKVSCKRWVADSQSLISHLTPNRVQSFHKSSMLGIYWADTWGNCLEMWVSSYRMVRMPKNTGIGVNYC